MTLDSRENTFVRERSTRRAAIEPHVRRGTTSVLDSPIMSSVMTKNDSSLEPDDLKHMF